MNPAQLYALMVAGLITQDQHTQALATRDTFGRITVKPTLTLELPAAELAADDAGRSITGIVSVYEQLIPSHGMILHNGSLLPREPFTRVKLLRDHDHADPVGSMVAFDADTLEATFDLPEGENGDRALLEASNGLRDGMSVGFTVLEYDFDDDWIMHVWSAELYETSLCAIPAIPDAGVTSVAAALATQRKDNTMNRAQLAAALAAGTITQAQHDARLAALEAAELAARGTEPATTSPESIAAAELAAGPELATTRPASHTETRDRGLSLAEVNRRIVAAVNTGHTSAVQLALADVLPAADAGEGYDRPEWLDQLFTANETRRPYIDAIGAPQPLNAFRAKGYRWADGPEVAEHAGGKTEVPTSNYSTVGDDFVAFIIAAGWDVDRQFVDFGDERFLNDFWAKVVEDYQIKSEAGIRTRVRGLKNNAAGTVTAGGVKAVVKQVIRDGRAIPGAVINRVFLDDTLFEEMEDLDTEKLPLWLKNATIGIDIAEGTAGIGQLQIGLDSTLQTGEVVAFDNRGLIVRERQIPQIRAIDVARGGIDLGFWSYLRLDDVDPRLVIRRRYVEPAA